MSDKIVIDLSKIPNAATVAEEIERIATSFQNRYIEDEQFLMRYMKLPWVTRLFYGRKIISKHIMYILEKYNIQLK